MVIDLAGLLGWRAVHFRPARTKRGWATPIQGTFAAGWPDLVLVRRRVIFAELKTDRGVLSDDQATWIDALHEAGQEAYVWRPSQWVEIERALKP